jgi:hypothetical protein
MLRTLPSELHECVTACRLGIQSDQEVAEQARCQPTFR